MINIKGTFAEIGHAIGQGEKALHLFSEYTTWVNKSFEERKETRFDEWLELRKQQLIALQNALTGFAAFVPKVKEKKLVVKMEWADTKATTPAEGAGSPNE